MCSNFIICTGESIVQKRMHVIHIFRILPIELLSLMCLLFLSRTNNILVTTPYENMRHIRDDKY